MSKELAGLDASRLVIHRNENPKKLPPLEELGFGKVFSNHMLVAEWDADNGWGAPVIKPYGPFSMDPSCCVFHYAFECFEGLKAFRDQDNKIRIFRPENNLRRLNQSSERICLPTFDVKEGLKLLEEFVRLEQDMCPHGHGYSLYLRPSMIGTQASIGVSPPRKAMLFVIASPVGPYFSLLKGAVRLEATDYAVRAWPGGCGNRKLGANYAPCVLPQLEAAKRGFQQNLWIFDGHVTEVGTMNLFVIFRNADGKKELCTPPLDGTILEGITRLSLLELARDRLDKSEWIVSEREIKLTEIFDRSKKGELLEVFGCGTAAVVTPVKEINYHDEPVLIPFPEGRQCGEFTELAYKWITDIQYGLDDHPFCKPIN